MTVIIKLKYKKGFIYPERKKIYYIKIKLNFVFGKKRKEVEKYVS